MSYRKCVDDHQCKSLYKLTEINFINDWIRFFHSRIENVEMGFLYSSYKLTNVLLLFFLKLVLSF